MHRYLVRLAALLLAATSLQVGAQAYPSKPVKVVVPFAAGGAVDIITRILGEKLQPVLGQPIVVEPVTGAGGNIGSAAVAKAPPDGYTLLMATTGTHTINPGLYRNMPFDAVKDFVPITIIASVPNLLVVHPSVPAKTVKELVELARAQAGKMNFASFGHGTSNHLSGELLNSVAGIKTQHVPYKSAPQAVLELVGGQVNFAFVNAPLALPQVKAGKLRALAVTGAQRSPAVPELPTMKEAGLDFVVESWYGFMAPAGTPKAVIDKIYNDTITVLKRPDVVEAFAKRGADVATSASPEEFAKMVATEKARWAEVIEKSGAKID
ncbi:MAG TPA: tripartite tricarboxylate transporter substrate binding protein [Usitatibacter sp.]|nr:tripartite tricarboxylate transporter substrate binding protein [Usitatibacter sp.]